MIKIIPSFASAIVASAAQTPQVNLPSSNMLYNFSFYDKTTSTTPEAQKTLETFNNIYGQQIFDLNPNYSTILANLPVELLTRAWKEYDSSRPNVGWIEPEYEWYANPAILDNLIQIADSNTITLNQIEKKFIDMLRPVLATAKITAKLLPIEMEMTHRYGEMWTSPEAVAILEDFDNFSWARYSKDSDGENLYLFPIPSRNWAGKPFQSVAEIFNSFDTCAENLISADRNGQPINLVEINQTISAMNTKVLKYQNDLIALLEKYKLIEEDKHTGIEEGLKNSGIQITEEQADALLQNLKDKVPGINLDDPETHLKVLGLAQVLENKDFSKLENLPQETLDKLNNNLQNFDLSNLTSTDLDNLLQNADIANQIDWNKVNLDHLDLNNMNFNHLDSLSKLHVPKLFGNASLVQKVIMGVAAGISAILAGIMTKLSSLLIRQKASGKSKTFVITSASVLFLIMAGLITGIFVG